MTLGFVAMGLCLVFGGAMGVVTYQWRKSRDERRTPVYAPRSVAVNRQAARDAVERHPWADTDRQTVPRQLPRSEPGAHRANLL